MVAQLLARTAVSPAGTRLGYAPGVFVHKPYDGSSPAFTIGLSNIDPHDWLEVDERLEEYLVEKRRLWQQFPDRVFVQEPDSEASQQEILDLFLDYLPQRHPDTYRILGDCMQVRTHAIDIHDVTVPALRRAASMVQDDLIVMRKGADGWRLAAGSLSFPSSWHLLEKFGKPMPLIHAAVPGFGAGSRNITLIERMFDHLRPGLLFARYNWGLYDGPELFHPAAGNGMRRLDEDGDTSRMHLRIERQTLRKLPRGGDILFTIRSYLDPFDALARQPTGAALARSLCQEIERLSPEQLTYKGLSEERERLLARLTELAGARPLDSSG